MISGDAHGNEVDTHNTDEGNSGGQSEDSSVFNKLFANDFLVKRVMRHLR